MIREEGTSVAAVEPYANEPLDAVGRVVLKEAYRANSHFSSEDMLARLREKGQDVTRSSLLRALPLLIEAGLLRETVAIERPERFKQYEHTWDHEHHEHFICRKCGSVTEFQNEELERMLKGIAADLGGSTSDHKVEIFGVCAECRTPWQPARPVSLSLSLDVESPQAPKT